MTEQTVYPGQFQPGDIMQRGTMFVAVDGEPNPCRMNYTKVLLRRLDGTDRRAVAEYRSDASFTILREGATA